MRVNIVTNLRDGKGLARDAEILRPLVEDAGHRVTCVDMHESSAPEADLTMCLEVCVPPLLGERNWHVPNPEWWFPGFAEHLPRFERVLCKTRYGLDLFASLTDCAELLGFESEDHCDAGQRERVFLHVAGSSVVKGTEAVMNAWFRYRLPWPLVIVGRFVNPVPIRNVTYHKRLPEPAFRRLQNQCIYHLCLSKCEGFGHYLHEALGVGACVISTDAPPMNEYEAAIRVPAQLVGKQRLSGVYETTPAAVRDAVERATAMIDTEIAEHGALARAAFLAERDAFRARLRALLEDA